VTLAEPVPARFFGREQEVAGAAASRYQADENPRWIAGLEALVGSAEVIEQLEVATRSDLKSEWL
jgi:hypothetical protein